MAQALLLLHRPSEIIRMDVVQRLADVEREDQYLAQSLLASAFFIVGMKAQGHITLKAAYDNVEFARSPSARMWVDYTAAKELWSTGEHRRAEELLGPICDQPGTLGAKGLALYSWIKASREQFDEQTVLLRKAWDKVPLCDDVYTAAMILHALAHLSVERYDEKLADFIALNADRMPWSPDTEFQHIETHRSVAWSHALAGRVVPALRIFRKNEALASDPSSKLLALVDRARVCYSSGEGFHYQMFIEAADELAREINWGKTTDEGRLGLLSLAALLAPHDALRARSALERYQSVTTPVTPIVSWGKGDRRKAAAEQYAAGVVQRYNGNPADAITHLRAAFSIYESIGYYWRACLAAHHLSEMGFDDDVTGRASLWISQKFPHAWFTPLFRIARTADPIYRSLGRVRRHILQLALEGKNARQIAEMLIREEKTIRNHLSAIFKAFEVHHIEDLRVECAKRGIT